MTRPASFKYFKASPEIIHLAVMLYFRFPLSLRIVKAIKDDQVDALTQIAKSMRLSQRTYFDTGPYSGRRQRNYRPEQPRREDRTRF